MTHEIMLKRDIGDESKKMKNLAFKVAKDQEDSVNSYDEDIALLTRKFNKFLKRGKFNQRKNLKRDKEYKKEGVSNDIQCFECKEPGHIRSKCLSLKKSSRKIKKKALAAWSDGDSYSDEAGDQEVANLCLMAKEEDEVSLNLSNLSISKFTLEELYDAFNELVEDFEKVSLKKGTKQVGIHGEV